MPRRKKVIANRPLSNSAVVVKPKKELNSFLAEFLGSRRILLDESGLLPNLLSLLSELMTTLRGEGFIWLHLKTLDWWPLNPFTVAVLNKRARRIEKTP